MIATIHKHRIEDNKNPECANKVCPDLLAARNVDYAYFKTEKRGFSPDHEMNDWHDAEKGILESL